MAKVAKSLRRLRTERGWTQEQLAEQLHVTRQAVSNWETGKTQPDIDTLTAVAALFETDLETLIYGSRKNVGADEPVQDNRIRIVLAVLGSLFLGVGLVLIFVNFWRDFPTALQAVFAVLPILIGQAAAAFVYLKKRDSVLFREGAAVLWFVGVIATVALVNSVFEIHCGFQTCLLFDIVLCLPVLWLFASAAMLPVYLGMVLCQTLTSGQVLLPAVLLALGILLTLVLRKDRTDTRYKFAVWMSTLAVVIFCIDRIIFQVHLNSYMFALFALLFFALLILDKERDWTMPFAPLGVLGCSVLHVFLSSLGWDSPLVQYVRFSPALSGEEDYAYMYSAVSDNLTARETWLPEFPVLFSEEGQVLYVTLALFLILAAVCAVLRRDTFENNIPKVLAAACTGGAALFSFAGTCAYGWYLGCVLCAVGFGIALLWAGVRNMRLTYVNIGLLVLFSQCIQLLIQFHIHILVIGVAFLAFGALLIGINIKLSRDKREQETAAAQAAVETEGDA